MSWTATIATISEAKPVQSSLRSGSLGISGMTSQAAMKETAPTGMVT